MNGATVYVGRARGGVNVGRAPQAVAWSSNGGGFAPNANGSLFWPTQQWPRPMGICQPLQQCCCAGPVSIAPGEVYPLMINWANWIENTPGFAIDSIYSASLSDPANAMEPADPDVIKVTTGIRGGDPDPPDNSDVADLISLVPPFGTLVLFEAAPDARLGAQYKLDLCLIAHDCDGRRIRQCQCLVLVVAEC